VKIGLCEYNHINRHLISFYIIDVVNLQTLNGLQIRRSGCSSIRKLKSFPVDALLMGKPIHVEWAPVFSVGLLLSGFVLIELALMSLFTDVSLISTGWAYWLLIAGLILAISGGLWLWRFLSTLSKFRRLLATRSKSDFIKNLDDIEYMAWKLPSKYQRELEVKKSELKIK
jgi:hypothetical protein